MYLCTQDTSTNYRVKDEREGIKCHVMSATFEPTQLPRTGYYRPHHQKQRGSHEWGARISTLLPFCAL